MKTSIIILRASEAEKELISSHAKKLGMTISDYLRLCATLPVELVTSAHEANAPLAIDATTYKKLLLESRIWKANFIRGIRALNTISTYYGTPPKDAIRAEEIVALSLKAMRALGAAKEGMDEVVRCARSIEGRCVVSAAIPKTDKILASKSAQKKREE